MPENLQKLDQVTMILTSKRKQLDYRKHLFESLYEELRLKEHSNNQYGNQYNI